MFFSNTFFSVIYKTVDCSSYTTQELTILPVSSLSMSISLSVPAPILSTHSHLHPLVHIFYALMHQAHSKTPPYIQLLPRLAGLTLPLEVTSSRKPTLLLLPPPNEFHPVPPALKAARSAHPRRSCHVHCPCLLSASHTKPSAP